MKHLFTIISAIILCSTTILAQEINKYSFNSNNETLKIDYQHFNRISKNEFSIHLKKYLDDISATEIDFNLTDEIYSLTGSHLTFQVTHQSYPIEDCLLKLHLNQEGTAYQTTHNIPKNIEQKIVLLPSPFPSNNDFHFEEKNIVIEEQKMVLILDKNEDFIFALKTTFHDAQNGIYKEQFSTLENETFENDLRHFADSTITGKVFLPDPLTSSSNTYGGAYVDGFEKDTTTIIVKSIENIGQSPINTGTVNFTIFGQTFSVDAQSYTNTFTSDSVYFYFSSLILDGDYTIMGYNTDITDNPVNEITVLRFEDYDNLVLNAERQAVSVTGDFDGTDFRLDNSFFNILDFEVPNILPVTSTTGDFDYLRSESGFEDINAFYHLNNFHNHLVNLGFSLNTKTIIDTHGNDGGDNSYFTSSPSLRISFGEGGVDDAEDADVVVHEYGHAISHMASPNTNTGAERKALDEGFGDYLATSYSKDIIDDQSEKVFTWDGHNEFWGGRFSNLNRIYTEYSASQNIYFNGAIWSASMMDLHERVGRTIADRLVIEVMHYNMPNGTMLETALNLYTVDSILYNKAHYSAIDEVLCRRAFIDGDCDLANDIIDLQDENSLIHITNTLGFAQGENATLTFENNTHQDATIWLFTIEGRLIFKDENVENNTYSINSHELTSGTYFLQVQSNKQRFATQLMVY